MSHVFLWSAGVPTAVIAQKQQKHGTSFHSFPICNNAPSLCHRQSAKIYQNNPKHTKTSYLSQAPKQIMLPVSVGLVKPCQTIHHHRS
jgi:hypothetical protein